MVTSKLDLTTPKDKTLATSKLAPIIDEIKDPVRQAHYLQKLARLVNVSERTIEATLNRKSPSPTRHKVREPKQEAIARVLRPHMSNPLEEDCLTLLLQHTELKGSSEDLSPEHFQTSENRAIFVAWQQANDLSSLKENLDAAVHEHLDSLINKSLPSTNMEQRHANYTLRLQERFLKSLEAKRAEIFALEAESGGTGADLAKLKDEGIDPSVQLRELQKNQQRSESRR